MGKKKNKKLLQLERGTQATSRDQNITDFRFWPVSSQHPSDHSSVKLWRQISQTPLKFSSKNFTGKTDL